MQDSWINDFLAFYNYIGPEPTAPEGVRWSVGRIDNNGNYEEGNVRWENDTTQARNHSIQSNNKTGIVGVSYLARTGRVPCWVGRYNEVDGKERSKEFSIKKYGYNRAKLMAIAFREEGMQKLKEAGAGYADSHGSVRVNKMGKINE